MAASDGAGEPRQDLVDVEAYATLLELWCQENAIKTIKLQALLVFNAILISAVSLAGGLIAANWYLYLAGAVSCAIATCSIGRTVLFQDVWQIKLADLRSRHLEDPRFAILETRDLQRAVRPVVRAFGSLPSKWYLLFSAPIFALAWLATLVIVLLRQR